VTNMTNLRLATRFVLPAVVLLALGLFAYAIPASAA